MREIVMYEIGIEAKCREKLYGRSHMVGMAKTLYIQGFTVVKKIEKVFIFITVE